MQEQRTINVEVASKENPIVNYQIPMPKTGINIKLIYTGATLLIICSTVLMISLKRKKTNI